MIDFYCDECNGTDHVIFASCNIKFHWVIGSATVIGQNKNRRNARNCHMNKTQSIIDISSWEVEEQAEESEESEKKFQNDRYEIE